MFLSRFRVKNYKCLGEIDIPLTPIHVLIGQNDSGKTSLLEAMAVLYARGQKPLVQLFPGPWSGRELVFHGSPEARSDFQGEWFSTASQLLLGEYGFSIDFHGGPQGPIQVVNTTSPSRAFRQVLKPAHKYALDAKLMAVPAAIDPERKFRLDPDGFGLPTLLDDILGHDPELFLKIRAEFCKYFPQFRSLRIQSEPGLDRHYSPTGIHQARPQIGKGIVFETQSGQTVRAQQASDGAILFLGFLALAHLPEPPTLLLIEEPENGIYPKRLGEVITLLKELVHRTDGVPFPQIILSTHSPYVLSFFEPEEVTFLSRDMSKEGAPVRARPLRDAPHIRERLAGGEFFLGELWYNLSEEELFGES